VRRWVSVLLSLLIAIVTVALVYLFEANISG